MKTHNSKRCNTQKGGNIAYILGGIGALILLGASQLSRKKGKYNTTTMTSLDIIKDFESTNDPNQINNATFDYHIKVSLPKLSEIHQNEIGEIKKINEVTNELLLLNDEENQNENYLNELKQEHNDLMNKHYHLMHTKGEEFQNTDGDKKISKILDTMQELENKQQIIAEKTYQKNGQLVLYERKKRKYQEEANDLTSLLLKENYKKKEGAKFKRTINKIMNQHEKIKKGELIPPPPSSLYKPYWR